ncbi:MAG: HAD family hydrolase [Candidatus Ornithospirochaeta sp.]
MNLNFFFDVDGTLLPFGKGLPESALEAIEKVKAMGHKVFVATGRSEVEMDPRLDSIEFDGGVYSAGCRVVVRGKEIARKMFSPFQKKEVLEYIEANGLLPMVQCEEGTFMTVRAFDFFNSSLIAALGRTIEIPGLVVEDEIPDETVANKILFLSPEGKAGKVKKDLSDRYSIVDNTVGLHPSLMAEICLMGVDKGSGIKSLLEALGEERKSSVAIGDGANDIEMVEYCGLGIAMGNSSQCLKDVADWITTDVEKDGIKNALEYAVGTYLPSLMA